ncbi:hypothetical protein QBC35DRAFT_487937 [Podospora australis]|uniref:Uncharacterized protein n=1 Tax=Podospora australis TaxID=1536484 RepID=A0AAN6WZM2_9PEZI|nr:hypothetical protein QBC35DRAFT_487937 [Podospora australis]
MAAPQRPLRTITILNFIPAFPLCIAHGALSHKPFPAVGLIPLFFSAVLGVLIIPSPCNPRQVQHDHEHDGSDRGLLTPDLEEQQASGTSDDNESQPGESSSLLGRQRMNKRKQTRQKKRDRSCTSDETGFLIFFLDVSLAGGLFAILVLTWLHTTTATRDRELNGALGMLAAYATIPLLVNFVIHLYLAIREFIAGLALHGFVQYAAWQTLPPDCPHCGERLRPDSTPSLPWFESLWTPRLPSLPKVRFPSISLPRPRLPSLPRPRVSMPKWLKRRGAGEHQPLFVDDAQIERDRYRDEGHDDDFEGDVEGRDEHGGPSLITPVVAAGAFDAVPPVVEEVVVVGKKDKKKRTSSTGAAVNVEEEEQAAWS